MNKKVLYTLEYYKITEQLASHASSDWAKEHCQHLKPMTDKAKIEQSQTETAAALSRMFRKGSVQRHTQNRPFLKAPGSRRGFKH